MVITNSLKSRFCKDNSINIKLLEEPYFSERLDIFENRYGARTKWNSFLKELEEFQSEREYFNYYNKVKESAISFIQGTNGYKELTECDMDKYKVNNGLSNKSIYKETLVGKKLISIDLKKGCFQALKWLDSSIVNGCEYYEDFIGEFCDGSEHITNSKYIRQVIFGSCTPRRQTAIEKYIMNQLLNKLLGNVVDNNDIVAFTDDEIVINADRLTQVDIDNIRSTVFSFEEEERVEFHFDVFYIKKVKNTGAYIKLSSDGGLDIKCADSLEIIFILRAIDITEVQENDMVFNYEGKLAKLMSIPKVDF